MFSTIHDSNSKRIVKEYIIDRKYFETIFNHTGAVCEEKCREFHTLIDGKHAFIIGYDSTASKSKSFGAKSTSDMPRSYKNAVMYDVKTIIDL
jgi:hypothetical protein